MTNGERAKRFRMARTELNRHGTETQAQVYTATKVSASAISNLENPENARMPSADMVNTLAEYYGVNAAWLTGQSESWSLNKDSQALTKVLGFAPKAADRLTRLMADAMYRNAVNELIGSDRFDRIIQCIAALTEIQVSDRSTANHDSPGNNPLSGADLPESGRRDLLRWKAEREMEALIRELGR